VASAFVFIIIYIYGLRDVKSKPDRKVSIFSSIKSFGWVPGLLLPGIVIDYLGLNFSFYLLFVIGILLLFFTYKFTKGVKFKEKIFP